MYFESASAGWPRVEALVKGALSRNSAKLGNHKMPVKLRETQKEPLETLKEG